MSRSILVAHDGSPHAQDALQYALETFPNARLVLFHAIDPFELTPEEDQLPPLTEEWFEEQHAGATDLFEDALEEIETESLTIETETAVGSPAQTIVAAVEETDVDGIVIGSRGRGNVAEARMGSTAELVVKRANVPVTVVR
ncbi:universal stress protein [Natronorubrum bangense]|uniref:UspA domain-containing protein n=2 Tax=Natronorubrum bangense TaxID=61858 RepID=L9WCX6_9EURY|nr:universal stress protein [Natronorubrum bangense]ELY47207.1 UspA domain-containing protein [Natronorubrum bangense JCM 10635]QCC53362.1 universal stress protein [Natronorubrum bangense]